MYDTLYQYLILHRRLSIPGMGTVSLQRTPAHYDVADKSFSPPSYSFAFSNGNDHPSKKMFDWLSRVCGVAEWDAIRMVNEFSYNLRKELSAGKEVNWENVGTFMRDESGTITFQSMAIIPEGETSIKAEKVIREHAQHTILVGETEHTSAEMEEILHHEKVQKNYGWIIALVLVILTVLFIGWYLSEKGLSTSSAGNQRKVESK